jgi:hypothetical protein
MYSCDPNVYQLPSGATDIIIPGQTVTIEREYRDPEQPEYGVDKVMAYGAKVLSGEIPMKPVSSGE